MVIKFLSNKEFDELLINAKVKKALAKDQALEDKAWDEIMDNEIRTIEECSLDPNDPNYPY